MMRNGGMNRYEATNFSIGTPNIGRAESVEQMAMFGLDSATRDIPFTIEDEGFF